MGDIEPEIWNLVNVGYRPLDLISLVIGLPVNSKERMVAFGGNEYPI